MKKYILFIMFLAVSPISSVCAEEGITETSISSQETTRGRRVRYLRNGLIAGGIATAITLGGFACLLGVKNFERLLNLRDLVLNHNVCISQLRDDVIGLKGIVNRLKKTALDKFDDWFAKTIDWCRYAYANPRPQTMRLTRSFTL